MTTELATHQPKPSALAAMASRFNVEPAKLLDTLKNTAFKGATDAQMMALVIVANECGLNPFRKEIYAFPDSKSGGIVPVIGVDGWYRMINDHPQFDGIEFEDAENDAGELIATECRIYRKDRTRPTIVSEYLAECRRNTDPWKTSPRRMLRHRAAIQCARIAFGMAGADPEDAERIMERPVSGRVVQPASAIFSAPKELAQSPVAGDEIASPASRAPAEETKPRRGRPPKVETPPATPADFALESEPVFPANAPIDEQIIFLLERDKISEGELIAALHRFKLAPAGIEFLGNVEEKALALAVSDWQAIRDDIAAVKGGAA